MKDVCIFKTIHYFVEQYYTIYYLLFIVAINCLSCDFGLIFSDHRSIKQALLIDHISITGLAQPIRSVSMAICCPKVDRLQA